MMPAAKHGDPQLGVDIHLCTVPPSPSPVPLPTPHISIVFDPFDYVPVIGATVTVCGMKRATAGTEGIAVHVPPGFPFAPKLPDKDDELFMGSSSVIADGDPFSYIALPVLSCQVAGMMSPFRPRKKGGPKAMVLPTVFNLAIPTTVFVGGPPTISLTAMAMKGAFAALGKFARSGLFKRVRQKLFKNMKPGFLKCKVLRAEPVNILTGEVVVEQHDFTLPGRIPIEWIRSYTSGSPRAGACGHGWETLADVRLEVDPADGSVSLRHPTVGPLYFERLPAAEGDEAYELELLDGARLSDHGTELRVRTKEDRIYRFPKALATVTTDFTIEYPIGSLADLCGNWLAFERQGGRVTAIQERAGRRIDIVRDAGGRISEVALTLAGEDFRHVFVRYEYDAAGDLVAAIDALGNPYRFAYVDHRLVRHTDRNGLSFYYEYTTAGAAGPRVTRSWGDGGLYAYSFGYDDMLRERRITDSLGHVWLVKLDERGLPIAEIDPLGGLTVFEYDDVGRTSAVVDQDGRRTSYEYDRAGNLVATTRPDGRVVSTEYDANGRILAVVDANGGVSRQKWDTRGLLVEETTALGSRWRYEYDDLGQLVAVVDPRGARSVLGYDPVGNVAQFTNALGHVSHYVHDPLGNVIETREPLDRRTVYSYDAKSRLTSARLPSGVSLRWMYDPADNVIGYLDENGSETRFAYFGQGEIAERVLPDGHRLRYRYDTEERLIEVVNQRGESFRLRRDALGRIVQEIDYWGQATSFEYSASGQIRRRIDPLGRVTTYATDPMGRVIAKSTPDASGVPIEETFRYDGNGNLLECTGPGCRIVRVFDADDRLTLESRDDRIHVRHAYDAAGNRIERLTQLDLGDTTVRHRVEYRYDELGELVHVAVDGRPVIALSRDASGQIVSERLGSSGERIREFTVGGHLTRQRISRGQDAIAEISYVYDPAGNLVQRHDSHRGTDVYAYDRLGRITRHVGPKGVWREYRPDPAGDRMLTRVSGPAVRADAERTGGAVRSEWSREGEHEGVLYRFDAAGNLVLRRTAGVDCVLVWDGNHRLVEVRGGGSRASYRYDALGRRIEKRTSDRRVEFVWDGDVLLAEIRRDLARGAGGDTTVREWIYVPDSAEPIALIEAPAAARIFHYHNDPNGAPVRVTSEAAEVVWSATYTPLGGIENTGGGRIDNPLRLQGQYADDESGLHYNVFRYFDPNLGQFVSIDPLRVDGGVNLYALGLNTFAWVDPLGLACYVAVRDPGRGVVRGKRLSQKQALARIRRGLDVIADSASEARSLAKRALVGKPMRHGPHGPYGHYLPHYHPSQRANSSHVFFP